MSKQRFLDTAQFAEAILNGEITDYTLDEGGNREYIMDESISIVLPEEE